MYLLIISTIQIFLAYGFNIICMLMACFETQFYNCMFNNKIHRAAYLKLSKKLFMLNHVLRIYSITC